MNDPRDFLTLCRIALPGIIVLVIGIAGCLTTRQPVRFAASFGISATGCLLVCNASAALHGQRPSAGLTVLILLSILIAVGIGYLSNQREKKAGSRAESHD